MKNTKQTSKSKLSFNDTMELNILETLEVRTSHLCNELRLNTDIHISWADLCKIISPSNPIKIADKIHAYYNGLEIMNDEVYHKIYDSIYDIGKNDDKFYHCDVLWISSISQIIYENFKDQWEVVVKIMEEIHSMYGSFDLDFIFSEAILTMRERCLIGDELFTCVYEYKKCNGCVEKEIDKSYEDYYEYEEENYRCDYGGDDLELGNRILH